MNVLIKGIGMPNTCHECRLYEGDIYYCSPADKIIDIPDSSEGRCSFCPLVPVPPHSRLIDADELKTAFPCGESVRTECVRATIDHAPTVIQTDEMI